MVFHFPLQAVLHLRESIEHQQELRLSAANQQVARVRHLIEGAEQRGLEIEAAQLVELGRGTTAAELRFGTQCSAELLRCRRDLEQQLAAAEHARQKQREIFQQAKRARETLESVRDRQLHLYQKKALRREQRILDNLFLLRRK
jgi:flagellar export protein FliJ